MPIGPFLLSCAAKHKLFCCLQISGNTLTGNVVTDSGVGNIGIDYTTGESLCAHTDVLVHPYGITVIKREQICLQASQSLATPFRTA